MSEDKIRILVAKPGLDGHDRGAKIIAKAMSDAGFEVIYTGLRQTPEQIAAAATAEDVDVVAMSILSGAHNTLFPRVVQCLREREGQDILVIGGGVIPDKDIPFLKENGIAEVFTPGTPSREAVAWVKKAVEQKRLQQ
ncbi:MAG: cobalamin B12-binding domain-containing protein [Synergistaceae bacterium]|jgi:methylmalonyl-CoA mutase C-terminal domain/subunit|nr:cobalamin B12-binding domain-containing protein [Synergistaceae bacterium]